MIPLLQSKVTNSHATLITLFMNAVDETHHLDPEGGPRISTHDQAMKRALEYLSAPPTSLTPNSPFFFKVLSSLDGVSNHEKTLDR